MRVTPIPRSDWPSEMDAALEAMMSPPTARHFVPPVGGRPDRPKGSNVMGAFAHHPDLARAFFGLNSHILYGTTLSVRHRQMIIFRVAAIRKCQYLWLQHQAYKADAGLSDEDVARVAFGPQAPLLDSLEAEVLRAVDELIQDGRISAETWTSLSQEFDTQQLLDLIFSVSCYDAVARMCNSLELTLETDVS